MLFKCCLWRQAAFYGSLKLAVDIGLYFVDLVNNIRPAVVVLWVVTDGKASTW